MEKPGTHPSCAQHALGGRILCFLKGMAFVPFLLVTWSLVSYMVTMLSRHVKPFLPYISDIGTTPSDSGILGFMINFSDFQAIMYTRYKIVQKWNQPSHFSTPVFNLVSFPLELVGCLRMGTVTNFRELAAPVAHGSSALSGFVCGVVYTLLQFPISYKSCPQGKSLSTCQVGMAISAISCGAVIPMIADASHISITQLERNPKEKDYAQHMVSVVCEWAVSGLQFCFLLRNTYL
ncbi:DNA damage-regulated autophagy modulator protein 1-like [Sturnira hondurensis]|uniref:DNA damage-regulated autophagy modulator protein 1-like n=1 Tax=Sturnira hondurensis TaxID=192404 RepID=UPI001879C662|nr:DNA damage-regulated autophagy modulator protein 1-like [Sturnira hondurensis]